MYRYKKYLRKLRQKERKYYSCLEGEQKFIYRKYRNPKYSINKNKKRIKKLLIRSERIRYSNIEFPENLNIYNQSDSRPTVSICNSIIGNHKYIFLDLLNLKLLSAAACALLLSSLFKAISMRKVIRCNYSQNEKSNAVLQKIGFFNALNKKNPLSTDVMNSYPDIRCWYVYKGEQWDSETIYNCVHDFTLNHLGEGNNFGKISRVHNRKIEINIKEIIGNTVEHAYPENYFYDKQWVLFAKYDNDKNQFTIIISDSGKTIPVTIVQYHKDNPSLKDKLKAAINSDKQLIKIAVQEFKSGTGKYGRGNGLKWVEESVQGFGGALVIYSGYGCYKSAGTTVYIDPIKLAKKIHGTIVDIMLPLDSLK